MTPVTNTAANPDIGRINCTIASIFGFNWVATLPLVITEDMSLPIRPANIIVIFTQVPPTFIPIR